MIVHRAGIDPKTTGKLRRRLLPLLLVLYVVAYLDRINIGFAAFSMNKELGITSTQFGLLTGIFFWGYFLFEVPSNVILHKMGARLWISRIMLSWGALAMLTGLVHSIFHLYAARLLLGVAEAGFFPGIVLYLTYWFREHEQAEVVACFLTGLPIASILGAPISGFILDHVHWLGVSSWRWLLILEGLPAIGAGVLTWVLLPSRPQDAGFLEPREKESISEELRREGARKSGNPQATVRETLGNLRVWHLACISFTYLTGLYTMSFWMPQAVKALVRNPSNTFLGVLVMIPHLVGLVVMILVSRSSDRTLERRYHSAIPLVVAAIALLALNMGSPIWVAIVLWSAAAAGIYSFLGPFWSLPSQFLSGLAAASGIALINSVGNLGGFVGPYAVGMLTKGSSGIYPGLHLVAYSLFGSALLLLLLPRITTSPDWR
jgi:ACS family tartrate transporter-like MFS transporter